MSSDAAATAATTSSIGDWFGLVRFYACVAFVWPGQAKQLNMEIVKNVEDIAEFDFKPQTKTHLQKTFYLRHGFAKDRMLRNCG